MVAPVAPAPAAATASASRKRLGKREKAQLRADSGAHPDSTYDQQQTAPSAADAVVDSQTAVWPWHTLSERSGATNAVVFSLDGA